MSESVIRVENLGKRYTLRQQGASGLLRDRLAALLRHPFRELRAARASAEEFWALREVAFSVNQGEVLGIIGRNGAGKSTLLKILSRITEPTTGRISIQGRVASLLEVGTGFHGELSGRENIFLNGAILGMTRTEIRKKFDEIVAFAEVERFLDTPVKHYSSGMYVRLAFAVAAHLEPEILIVDEVLAVGDAAFQKKCLGKMQEVARGEGRTVLFVSHNLTAVRELCSTGLFLQDGRVVRHGPVREVADHYLAVGQRSSFVDRSAPQPGATRFTRIVLRSGEAEVGSFPAGASADLELTVEVCSPLTQVQTAVRLSTLEGSPVLTTADTDAERRMASLAPGLHVFTISLPSWLAPGHYSVTAAVHEPRRQLHAVQADALQFEVTPGSSPSAALQDDRRGVVEPVLAWKHRLSPHVS